MRFFEAKQEFEIRYYLWSKSEFEKEIEEYFPNFRCFKSGAVWKTHQFMQTLKKNEQIKLAYALLRRMHPHAAKTLGESSTAEEVSLLWKHDNFFRVRGFWQFMPQINEKYQHLAAVQPYLQNTRADMAKIIGDTYFDDDSLEARLDELFHDIPSPLEDQIVARKHAGEKIKYGSKRKLIRVMAKKFELAFGDQCLESHCQLDGDPFLYFGRKCCGWIIKTNFWFGRGQTLLECDHSISSEVVVEHRHRKPDGSEGWFFDHLMLSQRLYKTEWEHLMSEDLESACDAAIKYCGHFFNVLPKLLKGLEYENILKEIHMAT